MKKQNLVACGLILAAAVILILPLAASAADPGRLAKNKKENYDLTGSDISSTFMKFMKCNAGKLPHKSCVSDAASDSFLFNYGAVKKLRNYHVIMLPGGDFDFLDELMGYCGEGKESFDVQALFDSFPKLEEQVEQAFDNEVCPAYEQDPEMYYDTFFDAYLTYEQFLGSNDISFTRLQFSLDDDPCFAGDRLDKINLLAHTIDKLEAQQAGADNASRKNYILMGHSFGGINIADFLVELLNGHVPGTPEYLMLANATVRGWTTEKRERIFKKIKGVALINTFVQGDFSGEAGLQNIAKQQNMQGDDYVQYYINRVITSHQSEVFDADNVTLHSMYHYALLSNSYRQNYYFTDKNAATAKTGTPIKDAFDRIARSMAVVSVGTYVPRYFPYTIVGPNVLVALSKGKWRRENIRNDGFVDSHASIIPREGVEYLVLPNLDHGALVLRPMVPGISVGHHYDQMPFIRTLFTRLGTRMQEIGM
jgi:hypothetical protein